MKKVFLSVIIPCYDEMANLRKGVLDKVCNYLDQQKYQYEVIIVDDGSKDGSIEFIKQFTKRHAHFTLLQNSHTGKAGAVTNGMLAAKGEIVLFADMDQATPIEEVEKLLPHFERGFDIVIGSRNMHREGSPLSRKIISVASIILRKLIVGLPDITDTQCGFKAFKKEVSMSLFTRMKEIHGGFADIKGAAVKAGFDMELLFLARKMEYSIKEVPVSWLYVESRRVSPVRDSIDGVLDLLQIRFNAFSGLYKKYE